MVSFRRSGLVCLSVYRSTFAFLAGPSSSSKLTSSPSRRTILATTSSIVAASLLPQKTAFASSTSSCDSPLTRKSMSTDKSDSDLMTGYLNAADASALDAELMSSPGFSLEQLMELAGLSVAEAVYQVIPPSSSSSTDDTKKKRILLICGPGNNGGDGLVAARHLMFFGYDCVVVYPKRSSKTHFINLVQQCEDVDIPIVDEVPVDDLQSFDAIVDAIFGFSFKGAPREPFATVLKQMQEAQTSYNIPVVSVDVPSGWNVDEGDVTGTGFVPQVLVSLTTPKESAKGFTGRHFVGGRFLPPKLAEKYNVKMPPYPGVSQVMDVTATATKGS